MGYSKVNLIEDLKELLKEAGINSKRLCFLVTESAIKEDVYLDYLNQYIVSSDIMGIFDREEISEIVDALLPTYREQWPTGALLVQG